MPTITETKVTAFLNVHASFEGMELSMPNIMLTKIIPEGESISLAGQNQDFAAKIAAIRTALEAVGFTVDYADTSPARVEQVTREEPELAEPEPDPVQ